MDPRLQEMLDHFEIRKTLAEYCHACDRADAAAMVGVYTGADSFDDHGHVKAPGPEFARIMADLIIERTDAIWHALGQSMIKVSGDRASAETFFLAQMSLPGSDGEKPRINQLSGRFVDKLEKSTGANTYARHDPHSQCPKSVPRQARTGWTRRHRPDTQNALTCMYWTH
jgi:SnoaL-like domain